MVVDALSSENADKLMTSSTPGFDLTFTTRGVTSVNKEDWWG